MEGTGDEVPEKPLVEPRLVKFLKDRPRLLDRGFRSEFLDQLERNMRQRRRPDTVAEKSVQQVFRALEDAGSGVAKERAKKAMDRANNGPLENL